MRRKIIKTDKKSAKRLALEENLLRQMRRTRASIDPKLLDSARAMIEKADGQHAPEPQTIVEDGMVAVDRKKVYETVLKFMTLRTASKTMQDEIAALLSKHTIH